jgi:hypothetical protein
MIKFPSIEQYRNIVHNITHRATYTGPDADGNPTYDPALPSPTLKFQGTVKLHGTNAGIARDAAGELWCQSRENIITPQGDNAGFAMYVHANNLFYNVLLAEAVLAKRLSSEQSMLIFGEWCGGTIQKSIAISQFPKMFVIFGMARVDAEGEKEWFTPGEIQAVFHRAGDLMTDSVPGNVYTIYEFPTYEIEIDFNRPHELQNKLVDLTIEVETECPVGKQLGATAEKGSIIGEGIVWKCTTPGYEDSGNWFKVKGEKHSMESKVQKLSTVDVERIDAINALAVQVTPEWRLEQMMQQTFDTLNGGLLDIKKMGDFIKAVMADVLKEDLDIIAASGFTTKDITGSIGNIARKYLMTQLKC